MKILCVILPILLIIILMIIAITNIIIIINKKKLCESYSTIDFKVEFDDDTEKNIKNDIMEYIENNRSYEIQEKDIICE